MTEKLLGVAKEGRLQVRASLCLSATDETTGRTVDIKQEILQGLCFVACQLIPQGKIASLVGADGKASFNKLKIMDVSSKHYNRSFIIQLQLEEMKNSHSSAEERIVLLGSPVKSSPLHVTSRLNGKRKRSVSLSSSGGNAKKRSRSDSDPTSFVDITPLLVRFLHDCSLRL